METIFNLAINTGHLGFTILIPIAAVTLLILGYRYPGYSPKTHWISNLGESSAKDKPVFNVLVFLYGFLGVLFSFKLFNILDKGPLSYLSLVFLVLIAASLIVLVFFPMGNSTKLHFKISIVLFLSTVLLSLTLPIPLYLSELIPLLPVVLSFFVFLSSLLFLIAVYKTYTKYKEIPSTMVDILPKEEDFWIKNLTVWEWFILNSMSLWFFSICLALF